MLSIERKTIFIFVGKEFFVVDTLNEIATNDFEWVHDYSKGLHNAHENSMDNIVHHGTSDWKVKLIKKYIFPWIHDVNFTCHVWVSLKRNPDNIAYKTKYSAFDCEQLKQQKNNWYFYTSNYLYENVFS